MIEYKTYIVVVFFRIEFRNMECPTEQFSKYIYNLNGLTTSKLLEIGHDEPHFYQVPQGDSKAHTKVGQP